MQPAEPVTYARFVCEAVVPAMTGTAFASKPMMVTIGTEAGITVEARYKFLRKLIGIAIDSNNFSKHMPRTVAAVWTASWDEISQLDRGPRSLVIRVGRRRGCWLAARPGKMMPLIELAAAKGVSIRRVRSTIGWSGVVKI